MQGDLLRHQAETLSRWRAQDIYRSILAERRDAEPYVLHDGPPYAAGKIHVGIGLNKVIKDLVAKHRSMCDRRVAFVPGWDCHGLPIETEVRKSLGARCLSMSAADIRHLCAESATRYVLEQKRSFQLLGIFADWDQPYLTMTPSYEAGVLSILLDFVEKGYVYRDSRLLQWCATCATTLADSEVDETSDDQTARCATCKGKITSRETTQWFVRLDHRERQGAGTLRERALLEIETLQWYPPTAQKRMRSMIEQRPDWCISRQRVWGIPLPAFVCRTCGEWILQPDTIRTVRDLIGHHGSSVWFEREAVDLLPPAFKCPACLGDAFERGHDILDVWFESSSSWKPVLATDHRLQFPADIVIEGSDQHRGWFQLSLLTAIVSAGKAPMRSVLTHGFVLNEELTPMMHSGGPLMTLEDAMNRYPADILRLFFASADVFGDITFPQNLRATERAYRTYRNTFRFLLGNLNDYIPREHVVHIEELPPLDLWALCRLHGLIGAVSLEYERCHTHSVVRLITEFCEEFSRLYLDATKDVLYYEARSSRGRRSAQTVLHSVLMGLVKLLAPILPYTCEEVWSLTPGHSSCASVHLSRWPRANEVLLGTKRSKDAEKTFSRFVALRRELGPILKKAESTTDRSGRGRAVIRLHVEGGFDSLLGISNIADLRRFLGVADIIAVDSAVSLVKSPRITEPQVWYAAGEANYETCSRCRRVDATCATRKNLCDRCSDVLDGLDRVSLTDRMAEAVASPEMKPIALARLLRARDIRRVAILNEGGRFQALALHGPSQEVRPVPELQQLADYANASSDINGHEALLLGLGDHTDALFGIGIHHLKYGTPLGGTRQFAYQSVGQMLDDLIRLSWGMSVKNSIAELPHGGGKSVIDTCGQDLWVHRELRRDIYRDFGSFTSSLFGRYICAEDMNNTTVDTREMLSACRHVMCLPQGVSGSGNPSRFTALVAWAAAKAGWKFRTGSASFDGLTIALQGAGNVGQNIVSILIEADPGIGRLLIADRDPEQIRLIYNLLLKRGKESILEVVSSLDPTDKSGSHEERLNCESGKEYDERGKDYVLFTPCDILIPAAVGKVINDVNVKNLRCALILPIANNVYTDNDLVSEALLALNITDVVENNVNWGGAMAAASELFGYDEDNVARACLAAFAKTYRLLEEAKELAQPPWQIVKRTANQRIFEQIHPAVDAARRYPVVGDVSKGFATWIREKWLRNRVDEEPDRFASYAVRLFDAHIAAS